MTEHDRFWSHWEMATDARRRLHDFLDDGEFGRNDLSYALTQIQFAMFHMDKARVILEAFQRQWQEKINDVR